MTARTGNKGGKNRFNTVGRRMYNKILPRQALILSNKLHILRNRRHDSIAAQRQKMTGVLTKKAGDAIINFVAEPWGSG